VDGGIAVLLLPLNAIGERFGIEIHEMDFVALARQLLKVEIVAIAGPEQTQPLHARTGGPAQQRRHAIAMLFEGRPMIPARPIQLDLPPSKRTHGTLPVQESPRYPGGFLAVRDETMKPEIRDRPNPTKL
jgi:hypothetical protein